MGEIFFSQRIEKDIAYDMDYLAEIYVILQSQTKGFNTRPAGNLITSEEQKRKNTQGLISKNEKKHIVNQYTTSKGRIYIVADAKCKRKRFLLLFIKYHYDTNVYIYKAAEYESKSQDIEMISFTNFSNKHAHELYAQ